MTLNRRDFVASVGWSFLASAAARADAPKPAAAAGAENFSDWSEVRAQFDLSPEWLHFSQFYIVSHPRPVRAAIERYRRMLDANPFATVEHGMGFAAFLGQQSQDVAFPCGCSRRSRSISAGGRTRLRSPTARRRVSP